MTAADRGKQAAATAAAALIRPGMLVGLGSGSTAECFVHALAARQFAITAVASSEKTAALARALGISLVDLDATPDIAIDGADEIAPGLALLKGGGGSLLREKLVAAAAAEFIVIADASKLVPQLGTRMPLPVEVSAFGAAAVARHLASLGGTPVLRARAGRAFVTDGGNPIYDCPGFGPITEPPALARRLDATPGVFEHGLFLGMARRALIGTADGSVREIAA